MSGFAGHPEPPQHLGLLLPRMADLTSVLAIELDPWNPEPREELCSLLAETLRSTAPPPLPATLPGGRGGSIHPAPRAQVVGHTLMSGSHFARWPQLERHRGRHLSDPSPEHGEPRDADEKPAPLGSPSATWCMTFITSRPLLRAFLEVHRPPLTWDVPLLQTRNPLHFILGAEVEHCNSAPSPLWAAAQSLWPVMGIVMVVEIIKAWLQYPVKQQLS